VWRSRINKEEAGRMSWQSHYPQNIIDAVRHLSHDKLIDLEFTETHVVFVFKWRTAKVKLVQIEDTIEALATCQHLSEARLLNLGNLVTVYLRDLCIELSLHPLPDT
jgi:hypothetical protein